MTIEKNFRPRTFDEYVGQEKAKKILKIAIKASKIKGQCLDHILISGATSSGKTTLAKIISNESYQPIKIFSGPAIKKVEDIVEILLAVNENDIIFIDEIHSCSKKIQEILYFAMEQFVVDAPNINNESTRVDIPHFTLIGATNEAGGLEEPCRNRFQLHINLEEYTEDAMTTIVRNVFKSMNVDIDNECAQMIGECTRGVPRNANSYCRRAYDVALVLNNGVVNKQVIEDTFDMIGINKYGLNSLDMKYLKCLYDAHKTVGVNTIALCLGTDKNSLETVVEPYLLKKNYITKTLRGRLITNEGSEIVKELLL